MEAQAPGEDPNHGAAGKLISGGAVIGRIDDFLLTKLERACHSFQRWTGLTNYWLYGKASLVICYCILASVFAYFANSNAPWLRWVMSSWTHSWFDIIFATICIPSSFVQGAWEWKQLESKAIARLNRCASNPDKISSYRRFWRLSWLMLCMPLLLYPHIFGLSCCACEWLRACDPLPPCESKLKQWWRQLKPAQLRTAQESA
jgi:hypothetical protein